jgi:hypothetical protein
MLKEEMIMAGQILVPFNSRLPIKDTIPVIKEAAKAGMSVVFLFCYPVDSWGWFRDHWVTAESARDAMQAGKKIIERYSWEGQRALAEEMVAPFRYDLQKIGVKTVVDLYTGSLSSLLENYSRKDEISFIMQAENDFPRLAFFHRSIGFFGLFKGASFRPVLSLRSGH